MFYNKFVLPHPSTQLLEKLKEVMENRPTAYEIQRWHKTQQPPSVNCTAGEFFLDPEIIELGIKEYKDYFTDPFTPSLGILRNTTGKPECYPAHSDRYRTIALNYYLDTGGDVSTVFYNKIEDYISDRAGGKVISHDNLPEVVASVKFETNQWYIFNARNYHSVENITSTRYIFGLCFVDIDLEYFINKYKTQIYD